MAKVQKKGAATRTRRRERKNIEKGAAHIRSSFNNTIVTITDLNGNAISWASSGEMGFRGSRKSTPFAAQTAAETAAFLQKKGHFMTPENYDPNTNESGDSYQSSHPYGVPEGQRPGPYQHYQQQPPVQPPRRTGSQALAAASMVMAICSFLFMLNMGSLFFGSLGVIFALLSRGAGRMSGTAKAGLAGCTIGIIVGICMYAFLLFNMVSGGSTNLLERYYNQYMQEYQMTPDNGTTTDGNTI